MSTAPRMVLIGGSAGAIQALSEILPALPADFPAPIVIVVHIPADRDNLLAPLFHAKCRMAVIEGEDKEIAIPGTIYFAPPGYHLLVEATGTLALSGEDPVQYSRPSIDVLFESAADALGDAAIGIVLTGANADGASGLQAIVRAGGLAIVQDPADAHADAMPVAAREACPSARVLPLAAIAAYLIDALAV